MPLHGDTLPNMTKDLDEGVATASDVLSGGLDTSGPPSSQLATTVIEPSRGWVPLNLSHLWEYREVLYFLVWRDIKVRYRQTLIGVTWAIIQPFMTMVVFSVFFGRLAKMPSDDTPYPLFAFAALVPWTFFASGLTLSANSLVHSGHLITKVYFPRLLVPVARVMVGLPDLALSFLVLLGMVWWYGLLQSRPALVWLPALALLAFVTALGVGLWLSALNVQYRDVQHAVPFVVQLWLFATPIAYPSSLLPGSWRTVYGLNPLAGVVEGFRWALLGSGNAPGPMVAASALAALVILVTGAFFFRRVERTFADVV
jgi:homopolymeric O-antigen transport system permease protein